MNIRIKRDSARVCLVLAAASLAAMSALPSAHAEDGEPQSVSVHYSVQATSTEAGAQKLYRQLQAASRAVCQPYQSRELARLSLYNTCYQQALANAVANVNLAALRAVHNERNTVRVAKNNNTGITPGG